MFECRLAQASLIKKIMEAICPVVDEINLECTSSGIAKRLCILLVGLIVLLGKCGLYQSAGSSHCHTGSSKKCAHLNP